ncbi:CU044_5270 family protein [Spirillospora sp. CA-128828]|uniref:CU044_5270 family protein n=1 Tax=Spirillospora sp. CA-128828 TaxID=3240033 RepID=UPI003D9400C1
MSDVLRTLREARPAELDPDAPVDEGVRRAELARAMAAAPSAPLSAAVPARRRMRPVWGLGLAGAVTAGAVAAAAVITTGGGATGGDGTGPGRSGAPTVTLDARTVLLAAAEKADGQSETMRAYWHQVTISSGTYTVGTGGDRYDITVRSRSESWTPSRPGGKQWGGQQDLGARPATKADEEAWRRAGAPTTFKIKVPVAPGAKGRLKPFTATTAPGRRYFNGSPLVDGDKVFWLGRNVTMKDLRSLPSDPKRLKAELMRWYKGHDTESNRPMAADDWLYTVARGLVMDMPVKPAVRAAGFRMLAGLPAVKSLGKVTDPEGRTGNAIGLEEKTPTGVIRNEMIIDMSSGTALASVNVMVAPAAGTTIPAGRTMGSTVTVSTEWTDSKPR